MSDLILDEERDIALRAVVESERGKMNDTEWAISQTEAHSAYRVFVDAILAAGFRRVSPVTREALVKTVAAAQAEYLREDLPEEGLTESETIADAILSEFSLPEPAEVEWNWMQDDTGQVPFTEGFASYEDAALFGPPGTAPAHLVRRTKATPAGPWVPVEKGEEQ